MKAKVTALALLSVGCFSFSVAGAEGLKAYASYLKDGAVLDEVAVAGFCLGLGSLLVGGSLRILASLAPKDVEAANLLECALEVFRLVPVPKVVRKLAARMSGLSC